MKKEIIDIMYIPAFVKRHIKKRGYKIDNDWIKYGRRDWCCIYAMKKGRGYLITVHRMNKGDYLIEVLKRKEICTLTRLPKILILTRCLPTNLKLLKQ